MNVTCSVIFLDQDEKPQSEPPQCFHPGRPSYRTQRWAAELRPPAALGLLSDSKPRSSRPHRSCEEARCHWSDWRFEPASNKHAVDEEGARVDTQLMFVIVYLGCRYVFYYNFSIRGGGGGGQRVSLFIFTCSMGLASYRQRREKGSSSLNINKSHKTAPWIVVVTKVKNTFYYLS